MSIRFDILTLFPEMFSGVLNASILGRAINSGIVECRLHNIRDYSRDKHRKVDDRPFGGGPGMVMMCQPIFDCVNAVEAMDERAAKRIMLSPRGQRLQQSRIEDLASDHDARLVLLAGHYEGVDQRVIDALQFELISVGDFVVTGGELPAMILIDAVTRLQPEALGHETSAAEDSFGLDDTTSQRLLDCPHYTRPRVWQDREVPDVLLSGDHGAVEAWRLEQKLTRTQTDRPDLLQYTPEPSLV